METVRILVADDSPAVRLLIEKAAKARGWEVCAHAKNGAEAAEKYAELRPDAVTMDITMPVKDGLAASKEILRSDPEAAILMLSAMGDDELIDEAKQIGITRFMKKPFRGEAVVDALAEMLGR